MRPQPTIEIDHVLLAETSVNPRWHSKNRSEWRNCTRQAACDLEDLFFRGKPDALAVDDLLERLRREALRAAQHSEVVRHVLQSQLLARVLEKHGLGTAVKSGSAHLGGLFAGPYLFVRGHLKLNFVLL